MTLWQFQLVWLIRASLDYSLVQKKLNEKSYADVLELKNDCAVVSISPGYSYLMGKKVSFQMLFQLPEMQNRREQVSMWWPKTRHPWKKWEDTWFGYCVSIGRQNSYCAGYAVTVT